MDGENHVLWWKSCFEILFFNGSFGNTRVIFGRTHVIVDTMAEVKNIEGLTSVFAADLERRALTSRQWDA